MKYTPAIQPESYSKLVKRSLQFYLTAFPHVILMALFAAIVAFTPRLIDVIWNYELIPQASVIGYRAFWILGFNLAFLILFTAILWRMQCRVTGKKDTLINDIVTAAKKLPRIFVASLIQIFSLNLINIIAISVFALFLFGQKFLEFSPVARLIISLSMFLQVFAAVSVFAMFYFYLPLILTENQTILSALKRSVRLVWGNIWRTISFQLTPWVVYLIVIELIRGITGLDLHIYFLPIYNITLLGTVLHIILFALLIPWLAINFLVQLRDLELRKGLSTL